MSGMTAFGDLIRTTREAKGWNQREFARRLDRDAAWVSRLENGQGKETPPPEVLEAIRRTLGVSMRSLLVSLGYLDADEPEPGIAYVIREGDPRAALLAILDGMPDHRVENITRAIALLAGVSGETNRGTGPSERDGTG